MGSRSGFGIWEWVWKQGGTLGSRSKLRDPGVDLGSRSGFGIQNLDKETFGDGQEKELLQAVIYPWMKFPNWCCAGPHCPAWRGEMSSLERGNVQPWGQCCAHLQPNQLRGKADTLWHQHHDKLISSSVLPRVILTAFQEDSAAFRAGDKTGMSQEMRNIKAGDTAEALPGFPGRAGNGKGISGNGKGISVC